MSFWYETTFHDKVSTTARFAFDFEDETETSNNYDFISMHRKKSGKPNKTKVSYFTFVLSKRNFL